MRIATMIIGLVLMLLVGLQSFVVYVGGAVLEESATSEGGALGILLALLFLIGSALVLALPLVSTVIFALAALIGFAGGSSSDFTDLTLWGFASVALVLMSLLGVREKRRRRRESASRVS